METKTSATAASLKAQPVVAQPVVTAAKIKQTNIVVEIMEGITLSALLVLFTALYMFAFSSILAR